MPSLVVSTWWVITLLDPYDVVTSRAFWSAALWGAMTGAIFNLLNLLIPRR